MKAVVIILSIIIFSACLIIGIQAGSSGAAPTPETHPGITATQPPQDHPNQRTILLIGVDDFSDDQPLLRSAWAVFFRPGFPHLTAASLYPNPDSRRPRPDLPAAFSLETGKSLSPDFLSALGSFSFAWDGYIIMDDAGTALLVDWLGGVYHADNLIGGTEAVSLLADARSTLSGARESQADLGAGLCRALAQSGGVIDWDSLAASLQAGHMVTSLDIDSATADLQSLLEASQPLTCEFPSLVD